MPNIRPISDLRNSANEISDFCKQTREPESPENLTKNSTFVIIPAVTNP